MKKLLFCLISGLLISSCEKKKESLSLSVEDYRDRMKGAWIGQMAGVGWGLPTEFDWIGTIIPEKQVPKWNNNMVNQQGNDDLYVEITFLQSMEEHGLDVSIRQAGIDFANTGYTLWAANFAGRENLRYGIAPPESSHPEYNKHCDDIDYQIEADYSGIIAPGMPNVPIQLGKKFGRLMNYGDGMYAGQFVGGMYSEAYFSNNIDSIIEAGLKCIPSESLYARVIRDVMHWHGQYPDDWQKTWNLVMDKYYRTLKNQPFVRENEEPWVGIDAKVNGAFIVMGLLYGEGDMEKTIRISMRCGFDSDCNPSNAAGIVGAMMGYSNIPEKFKAGLDKNRTFSYSDFDFTKLLDISEQFTREYLLRTGGEITIDADGNEYLNIPVLEVVPSEYISSYEPGPFDPENRYDENEMQKILAWSYKHFQHIDDQFKVGLQVRHCGKAVPAELITWNGKDNVFKTVPMDQRGVRLIVSHTIDSLVQDRKPLLVFHAGHETGKQWKLTSKYNRETEEVMISGAYSNNGWMEFEFPFNADGTINLNLEATDINDQAVNYWTGFNIVYR